VVGEVGVVTIAESSTRRLPRIDKASKQALGAYLSSPRYEVLPTDDVEERVLAAVPRDVTITVTASPRRDIDATISLAERLGRHGYQVVPHISARLIRDDAHLREVLERVAAIGRREIFVIAGDAKLEVDRSGHGRANLGDLRREHHCGDLRRLW